MKILHTHTYMFWMEYSFISQWLQIWRRCETWRLSPTNSQKENTTTTTTTTTVITAATTTTTTTTT